jgi:rhodanese-related sulfurtransferase
MSGDAALVPRDVSVEGVTALLGDGAVLLDVREPEETAAGRIESAVAIPLGELAQRLDELPSDTTIVVVCRSGNRSSVATRALNATGFDAVNVAGGMLAWRDAGLPLVSDASGAAIVL